MSKTQQKLVIYPIGHVKRNENEVTLKILKKYSPALKELDSFSHVHVFWWADRLPNEVKNELQCTPPYGENPPITGIFATRAEYRPNPISVTIAKILEVDYKKGIVKIENIDAFDGTPILDLKAYFPICDKVEDASVPSWIVGWPDAFPPGGIGFFEDMD